MLTHQNDPAQMQTKDPSINPLANQSNSLDGGCQCGTMRFRIVGQPLTLYVCHCKDCQKQSSSAFGMSLWVNAADFNLISGELSFYLTYGESGTTKQCGYCDLCGSRIFHTSDQPNAVLSVKAGSLDDTSKLKPVAHIWTRSAQPWVTIDRQQYPCFETEPPGDQLLIDLWQQAQPR